ncbi:MAG: hypothetical protein JO147_07595 [Actinobacteria bacterium]|nr:hypothetical protein [Actinomycetota bacterium]
MRQIHSQRRGPLWGEFLAQAAHHAQAFPALAAVNRRILRLTEDWASESFGDDADPASLATTEGEESLESSGATTTTTATHTADGTLAAAVQSNHAVILNEMESTETWAGREEFLRSRTDEARAFMTYVLNIESHWDDVLRQTRPEERVARRNRLKALAVMITDKFGDIYSDAPDYIVSNYQEQEKTPPPKYSRRPREEQTPGMWSDDAESDRDDVDGASGMQVSPDAEGDGSGAEAAVVSREESSDRRANLDGGDNDDSDS